MKDRFGRELEDLRITLTHVCNFSCFFCHMEGEGDLYVNGLTPEEIQLVAEVSKDYGIKYVKLTGGEPTLRRDLTEIIYRLKNLGLEVSMTTNGYILSKIAGKLKEAGLSRVNISLHTLDRERFKKITGVDGVDKVIEGIKEAVNVGLKPVKLNFVATKVNVDEVFNVIDFAEKTGVNELHLIEMHPVGMGKVTFSYHEKLNDLENILKEKAVKESIRNKHYRPRFYLPSGLVVEIIKPYANPIFCSGCNRIRLTVDGKLKTCLYRDDNSIDILNVLRSNLDLNSKKQLIREAFEVAIAIREPNFKYII
ncbi:GTP 3',8-cyclase MoaA [Acidianus sulfidivorans JP7]|uniref:Probable GTP 3',8-cyclase n=1 Tax=Acidianus sulfidivorans JP7 TaxID=619593 RepID=A0A2U9INS1_9CREN|nr:GTP 3',8-cyclase MoaA [Acidianus sulfidivorans]AWR97698.1 GTP 3',8-cyclase MoaA [Acidianus sulfidivorans JP7]